MTPMEARELLRRFAKEHEESALAGYPGRWEDLPSIRPLMDQLAPERQTDVREAAALAYSEYLQETSGRHRNYEAAIAAGADKTRAWQVFLKESAPFRKKFQAIVTSRLVEAMRS